MKNMEEIDANPGAKIGLEMEGFFPFVKNRDTGSYQYIMFPRLDVKMMNNPDLMNTYDRQNYIEIVY